VDFGDDSSADQSFDRSTFSSIEVFLRSGNGRFRVDQIHGAFADEALTVHGAGGHDTLDGGDGAELFDGGSGRDAADGNRGNDTGVLGSGWDSLRWDPGDGSDVRLTRVMTKPRTAGGLAAELGLSGTTVRNAARRGLTDRQADEWAIRLGLHPLFVVVWGWARIDPAATALKPAAGRLADALRARIARVSCARGNGCPAYTPWPSSPGSGSRPWPAPSTSYGPRALIVGGIGRGRPATVASTVPAPSATSCTACGRAIEPARSTTRTGPTARWPPRAGVTAKRPRTPSAAPPAREGWILGRLTGALTAANRGWPVFPLRAGTKRPRLREWETVATTSPDRVRWW